MLKRKFLTITLAILLLTITLEARYNGQAAANYARYYSGANDNVGYNDRFYVFYGYGGDCTNFISQALYYGGLQMNKKSSWNYDVKSYVWYYLEKGRSNPNYKTPMAWRASAYSYTWKSASALRARFTKGRRYENVYRVGCQSKNRRLCSNQLSYKDLKVGDVIFLSNGDTSAPYHTMMVTSVETGLIWSWPYEKTTARYSGHTSDTNNKDIRDMGLGDNSILEYWRPY